MKSSKSSWEEDDDLVRDMRNFVDSAARIVAKHGLEYEKSLMNVLPEDSRLNANFLTDSEDPYHGYYHQKLSEYQNQEEEEEVESSEIIDEPPRPVGMMETSLDLESVERYFAKKGLEAEKVKLNERERVIMKLTAQFVAWYGHRFWLKLTNKDGFEFFNGEDSKFPSFNQFLSEYKIVLWNYKDLKTLGRKKDDAYYEAVLDGFLRLLDSGEEGGMNFMTEWHASFEKEFYANKELPPPEGPEPNPGF